MSKILPPGTVAPGFTLPVTPDQNLSLSDLTGRPVILAFYPADWSPVCGDQMVKPSCATLWPQRNMLPRSKATFSAACAAV
jgi:peroxiredoxin